MSKVMTKPVTSATIPKAPEFDADRDQFAKKQARESAMNERRAGLARRDRLDDHTQYAITLAGILREKFDEAISSLHCEEHGAHSIDQQMWAVLEALQWRLSQIEANLEEQSHG